MSLGSPEAVAPFAEIDEDYDTISGKQICTEYLNDGVVSIDLSALTPSAPDATLIIGDSRTSAVTCVKMVTKVSITRSSSDGYENLHILQNTFYQEFTMGESNKLESVVLPETLESLEIDFQAFYQFAYGAENALRSVVFPRSVETLEIGYRAFYLAQSPKNLALFFPFGGAGVPEVSLGTEVTNGSGADGSAWVWLGENGTDTEEAWGTANSYALYGALSAELDANGGVLPGDDWDQLFVFPAVDGVPQVAPLSGLAGLDPARFVDASSEFVLVFPEASPAGSWGEAASFAGWCDGAWIGGVCGSELFGPDAEIVITADGGLYTFTAVWEATPVEPSLIGPSCGAAPTVNVPPAVDGLYKYKEIVEGDTVTVTATPADYVSLTRSAWSFGTALTTFTVSFDLAGGQGQFAPVTVYDQGCSITLPSGVHV